VIKYAHWGEKMNSKNKESKIKEKKFLCKRNILSLLCFLVTIIFIIALVFIDLLPSKYVFLFSVISILIDIIGISLLNVRKSVLKIIGIILIFLSIIINGFGIYYLSTTDRFMKKSFTSSKKDYQKNTYYVLSLSSKNRKKDDISSEVSAYSETVYLDKAIEKLNKKYKVEKKEYQDIDSMFDNFNSEIDSFLLIEKSSYDIVSSISDKINKDNYDILYQFDVFTEKDLNKNRNIEKFNVYIGGTDFAGLMDFNMIVTVNTATHKVLLTSIPRDYYIEVIGKDGRRDKLSFMKVHGIDTNKDSLANFFDTNIDYSVIVDTNSLVDVVDYVGGIDFCSDYNFTTTHALVRDTYVDIGKKLTIHKGCQHLNGIETLTVARERIAFPGSDQARQENCQKIILSIFKKIVSPDTMLHYNRTLNTLSSLYETNIPKKIVTDIAKDVLSNSDDWKVETQAVSGEDGKDKVYLSNLIDWVMYPNMDTVDAAKIKIKETLE